MRGVDAKTGRGANWKGGRTVTSHGYVLVWVGKDHPMADVRGYAYEHRLVAAARAGRALETREQVHHDDEVRSNNAPDNLVLEPSIAAHRLAHRKTGSQLRMPGEANPRIACACGCGEEFDHYDATGRPRRFVSGHNPPAAPTADAILALLAQGPHDRRDIASAIGSPVRTTAVALSKLKRDGRVVAVARGVWALRNGDAND